MILRPSVLLCLVTELDAGDPAINRPHGTPGVDSGDVRYGVIAHWQGLTFGPVRISPTNIPRAEVALPQELTAAIPQVTEAIQAARPVGCPEEVALVAARLDYRAGFPVRRYSMLPPRA